MPYIVALSNGLAASLGRRPLVALVSLFAAGVATSLTPCIYPMIPITAGLIAGPAASRRSFGRTVGLTLTYVAGLALLYATLGLVAGLSGNLFGTVSSSWWARLVVGNLLLLFGLGMLDVMPVAAPTRLAAWAGSLSGGSYPAVFLMGATSGVVAAPCGAPAFAAVLTWVASSRSGVLGFGYLLVFSLGMTAILAVVGLFSGAVSALPAAGTWMTWIKRGSGVVLLGMAEYYFILAGQVW
jgi:thiol:disulfide interchange protein DsbD